MTGHGRAARRRSLTLERFLQLTGDLVGRGIHSPLHHFVGICERLVERLFDRRLAHRDQPCLTCGELPGQLVEFLTRQGPAGGLHTFKIRVSPRRCNPPAELPVHEGQEWIYVLSGRLRLVLGERDFTINPGEAVEFSTWTPHWFGVIDAPVEAIMMFGPHGERLHLHS